MVVVNRVAAPRRLTAVVSAVALLTGLTLALAPVAGAEAGPAASCVGHEASGVSPPGSSDELPGGMPQLLQFIKATFPGTPPGAVVSAVAKLHEGSHQACDEATEGG